jgi:hypothetical protein
LQDWRGAGLNVACGFKAQIATVEEVLVRKVVGRLSEGDSKALEGKLRSWRAL